MCNSKQAEIYDKLGTTVECQMSKLQAFEHIGEPNELFRLNSHKNNTQIEES